MTFWLRLLIGSQCLVGVPGLGEEHGQVPVVIAEADALANQEKRVLLEGGERRIEAEQLHRFGGLVESHRPILPMLVRAGIWQQGLCL